MPLSRFLRPGALPNWPLQPTAADGRPLRGLPLAPAAERRYVGQTGASTNAVIVRGNMVARQFGPPRSSLGAPADLRRCSAEVFDLDGRYTRFANENDAIQFLLEDEYTRYDRLERSDLEEDGVSLDDVAPPTCHRRDDRVPFPAGSPVPRCPPAGAETVLRPACRSVMTSVAHALTVSGRQRSGVHAPLR